MLAKPSPQILACVTGTGLLSSTQLGLSNTSCTWAQLKSFWGGGAVNFIDGIQESSVPKVNSDDKFQNFFIVSVSKIMADAL